MNPSRSRERLLRKARKTERGAGSSLAEAVVRAAPFALLRKARKTERGAICCSLSLTARAAPFAFWAVTAALLLAMGVLMLEASLLESQSWDEALHLTAGFSYWKTGDFRLNPEHPPLSKLLAAAPLLFTDVGMPQLPGAWKNGDLVSLSEAFLYANKVDAERMLLLGRATIMLLTLALGLAIAVAARARWGAAAGLCALALYATDPNFIAHGHYITSDAAAALGVFAAALTWERYLDTGRRRDLAFAAAALGVALSAKFSAVFFVPLLWVTYWLRRPKGARHPVVACAAALVLVLLCYGPESWRTLRKQTPPLADHVGTATQEAELFGGLTRDLRLRVHPYLNGLWDLYQHNHDGHRSYLLGKVNEAGSVWFFPVAFAVKSPVALLVMLAAGIVLAAVGGRREEPGRGRLRACATLALYPAAFVIICLSSRVNIGLRHLLPLYPFLYLFVGWAAARALASSWRKAALTGLGVVAIMQAAEVARVRPHYTAFFNAIAGGPENGRRYLVDSNLDWGQDLKKLKRWMEANRLKTICLSYFGSASTDYYKLKPIWFDNMKPEDLDCVSAVSATNVYDVYFDPPRHQWLLERTPVTSIGHSLLIYDFRKKPEGRLVP